ncbi:MAG: hypothetical protein JNJ77_02000 [Planctomycetia bacterium]|nr:hypothetical protein [Planctomycetia bacterium]
MPILHQSEDDGHWYIKGSLFGEGFCTWQIRREGLEYLNEYHLQKDGKEVPQNLLLQLKNKGWIYTGGSGIETPVKRNFEEIVFRLSQWAVKAGVTGLNSILHDEGKRKLVFAREFLHRLKKINTISDLNWLANISQVEFERLTKEHIGSFKRDSFHDYLYQRGKDVVLWRLAQVVGMASLDIEDRPFLKWLKEWLDAEPPPPVPLVETTLKLRAPNIVWDTELQQVVAVLPEQNFPSNIGRIRWDVNGQTIPLSASRGVAPKQTSKSLPPLNSYHILLFIGENTTAWSFYLPTNKPSIVLFHLNGELINDTESDRLLPGEYLALIHQGQSFDGVIPLEHSFQRPMLWTGWEGRRITVKPGSCIPGYQVLSNQECVWELSEAPTVPIRWADSYPVYLGSWPKVHIQPADAILRISDVTRRIDVNKRITSTEPIDLNTIPTLTNSYGRFSLSVIWPDIPDRRLPTRTFTRLPQMNLEYIHDPIQPDKAMAVCVKGVDGGKYISGEDSDIRPNKGDWILRTTNPTRSPGVIARHPDGWEIRVRVAVNRGRMILPTSQMSEWQLFPLQGIDLDAIGLNERIQLEFLTPPQMDRDRLIIRLENGREVFIKVDGGNPSQLFEIPLHRWRDVWGQCGGKVQVFLSGRWITVAELQGAAPTPPSPVITPDPAPDLPRPTKSTRVDELFKRLEETSHNEHNTSAIVAECWNEYQKAKWADRLLLTAARTTLLTSSDLPTLITEEVHKLALRGDIPGATPLAELIDIRRGGIWDLERVNAIRARGNEHPDFKAVLAECWYRFARNNLYRPTHLAEALSSAQKQILDYLRTNPDWFARSEAVLLRELIGFLQTEELAESLRADLMPMQRRWAEGLRLAGRYLRTPVTKWEQIHFSLLDPVPPLICARDAELVRVILRMAGGDLHVQAGDQILSGGRGFHTALPLLRARLTRMQNDYRLAQDAVLHEGPDWMLGVIIAEFPKTSERTEESQ